MMMEKGKQLGELKNIMVRLPQVLLNVQVREKKDLSAMPRVKKRIADVQRRLKGRGRTLVRYSGTEMLARVMLEGEDEGQIRQMAEEIADEIRVEVGA